ncbi:8614_t:CDS:2, partial [Gigaspora margarita]
MRGSENTIDFIIQSKTRYNAFYKTELNSFLTSLGIKTLIISGVKTNLCCKTTARRAFDENYDIVFIENATATDTQEMHEDQKDISEWTFVDKNYIEIDIVKSICYSITEEMIMNLDYSNPLLSYVVYFSNLSKEIKDAFDEQALITMTAPPIKFYRDMDLTLEKYLVYMYENQQKCEKLFPQKKTCEQLDQIIAPFLMSLQAKKTDTWIEMMIAKSLHEIVFAKTLGSPFQATCTIKKVYNDKYKLICFGHDSKNKMLNELIEKKYIYLSDWRIHYNDIYKAELLLLQPY